MIREHWLVTCNDHHENWENLFVVGLRCHVSKPHTGDQIDLDGDSDIDSGHDDDGDHDSGQGNVADGGGDGDGDGDFTWSYRSWCNKVPSHTSIFLMVPPNKY